MNPSGTYLDVEDSENQPEAVRAISDHGQTTAMPVGSVSLNTVYGGAGEGNEPR